VRGIPVRPSTGRFHIERCEAIVRGFPRLFVLRSRLHTAGCIYSTGLVPRTAAVFPRAPMGIGWVLTMLIFRNFEENVSACLLFQVTGKGNRLRLQITRNT
jgi:hypothetical protein